MAASITIEPKPPDAKGHAAIIRKALKTADSRLVSASQAAHLTGLPIDRCRDALLHLYSSYPGDITVDDTGELRFSFTSLDQRRPSAPAPLLGHWLQGLADWYGRHTDKILALITLPLVPPFLFTLFGNLQAYFKAIFMADTGLPGWALFLLTPMHMAAGLALLFSGIGACMSMLVFQALPIGGTLLLVAAPIILAYPFTHHGKAIHLLFFIPFAGLMVAMGIGMLGYFWTAFKEAVFDSANNWASQTWRVVGRVLFGPPPTRDALSDERRLTALIREQGGVLCRTDVMAQFGWTLAQAEQELTRILLDYGGEIAVSPKGAVLFRFRFDHDEQSRPKLPPVFERPSDQGPFWDFPLPVIVIAALTVAAALVGLWQHPKLMVLPNLEHWVALWGSRSDKKEGLQFLQGFGAWPYLFVLIPNLIRGVVWSGLYLAWQRQKAWWPLLRLATENPRGALMATVDSERLAALGGTVDPDKTSADGQFWVTFPAHALEQHDADRARRALRQGAKDLAQAIGAETV